jgi:hypothetical protein
MRLLAGDRMVELEPVGVQELTCEPPVRLHLALPVRLVTDDRVVDVGHVHADLVRAACVELALHQRVAIVMGSRHVALEHAERGDGLACRGRLDHRHLLAVARVASERGVDEPRVRRDVAVHEGEVAPVDGADLYRLGQSRLRAVVLRDHHQTRGVLVEPVHDAWTVLPLQGAELACVREQRVHEGASPVALRGMDDEVGLLGEHDHVVVLEPDVERYVLGLQVVSLGRRDLDRHELTGPHDVAFRHELAVDEHESRVDQARRRCPRNELIGLAKKRVEALTGALAANGELETLRTVHGDASPYPLGSSAIVCASPEPTP